MKKKISALLALILILSSLCSCKAEKSYGILKLDSGEVKVSSFIKLNGKEISYDLFRYSFLTQKANIESQGGEVDWPKQENIDILLDETVTQLKFFTTVSELCKKYNVSVNDDILADVDSTMKTIYDGAKSAEEYKKILSENYLTPEIYEEVLTYNALYTYMEQNLVGKDKDKYQITFTEEEALESFKKTHARLPSIYFPVQTANEDGSQITEEQYKKYYDDAKKKADEAYNKAKTKGFEVMLRDYLSEEDVKLSMNSYYDMASISQSVGFDVSDIKVGEIANPICSQNNFFVIQRAETDIEYVKQNLMDEVNSACVIEKFGEIVSKTMDGIKVEKLEHFDKINTKTLV